MASVLLLTHSLNCSQEEFNESLKEYVNSRTNSGRWSSIIPELDASTIKQCVIGPNHLAFLTREGRVCRVSYQIDSEAFSYSSPKHSSEEETSHPPPPKKSTTAGSASVRSSGNATNSNNPTRSTQPASSSGDAHSQSEHTFSLSSESLSSLSGQLGRWAHRVVNASNATTSSGTTSVSNPLNMRATTRGRARILRAARGRVGSGWLSGRAIIPASAVPEELISQAQVVLQGKSRQAIIRELQKTSLDVNLAVNNLLSRDDDDPEEPDDESYMPETYFPGEDLMSIFETGIPNDEQFVVQRDAIFPEDIIYNPSYNRSDESRSTNRTNNQGASSSSGNREEHSREFSSSCVRDRWWGMLLDRSEKSASGSSKKKNLKDKSASAACSSQKFGDIQWWDTAEETDSRKKFVEIVSMHSELIGITSDGYLQQWFWKDPLPFSQKATGHCHKRSADMNLTDDEKVTMLAAQNIRVSILTESGKIATWLDDTLAAVGHKLEHPLQTFFELKGLAVTQLQVCDLYSCVQLSNGSIHWWGVFPFEQRRKILDKVKTKAKKSAIAGSNQIKSGTLVCIRSCPLYYPGAIGFATINGEPKVGELLDKAWSITEKCRFKILEKGSEVKLDVKKDDENVNMEDGKNDGQTEKVGIKRKRSTVEDSDKKMAWKEEEWCLQDVIFVEDVRHVPVGEVLKVDGAYAMVHFSSKLLNNSQEKCETSLGVDAMLKESVIRRKDELQIVKWTTPPKMPECYQKVPKELNISGSSKILTMTLDKKGVHALIKSSNGLRYAVYSLASSRPDPGGVIHPEPACFLSKTIPNSVYMYPSGTKSNVLLKDPNNCLYPLVKDNVGGMQNPVWANLSSINCLATGRKRLMHITKGKAQVAVTLVVMNENHFLQAVLRSNVEALNQILSIKEDITDTLVSSKCDGNRNVLHLCVNMCQPSSSKSTTLSSSSKALDASAFFGNAAGVEDSKEGSYEAPPWIPLFDSMACLELILNSTVLSDHIYRLLSEKDAFGYTPFMIAVRVRAYPAAVKLYNAAVKVSTNSETGCQNKEQFMSMIYPSGSDSDMSPLHMLCCNDTCSFTWTGTKHINQDIFECKTCGLVGPLCCCTECAQVCHIGHECKLKRTSPTAYCDCWEKCPCKSLVSGDQEKRKELLFKLVEETDLSTKPNNNGHHILLFLAQTVSRQASEQEQYVPNKMTDSDSSKQRARINNSERRGKVSNQTPPIEHEQEPPKFSKISLTYILKNWTALKSMIMFGCKKTGSRRAKALDDNLINSTLLQTEEIGNHLDGQKGTAFLDNFVHKLIVKCNGEFLEVLLQTLLYRLQEDLVEEEYTEILTASRRFIRSVVRVYVVLIACTGANSTKKKSISASITKCKHVFQSLNVLVAQEMADIASSIFAPVRMGVVYPSAPFTLGSAPDSTQTSEELFSTPPLPERFSSSISSSQSRVRFMEQPSVEQLEERGNDEEGMETEHTISQSQASGTVEESLEENTVPESDVDIDLMAESDSDSEESNNGDAADNADPTTRSESSRRHSRRADGYHSTAEASETEGEDDDDGEEEDDDDDDDDDEDEDEDEMENQNDTSEQRNNSPGENNTAPHALQWAVRNTQSGTSASSSSTAAAAAAHVSGSGLVFIDTSLLRRSGASAGTDGNTSSPMYCTPSALARTFSMLIREISDLLNMSDTNGHVSLPLAKVTVTDARETVDKRLYSTWEWLWRIMEETEAKLRFGASLTAVSDPGHPQHPLYESQTKAKANRTSMLADNPLRAIQEGRRKKRNGGTALTSSAFDSPSARQEYLTYILSLMRSHHDEHADLLPKLEITSLRHVAYVLDSFIYYLRAEQLSIDNLDTKLSLSSTTDEEMGCNGPSIGKKNEDSQQTKSVKSECDDDLTEDDESEVNDVDEASDDTVELKLANHRFFKRSDSTLVLGYEPADPFLSPLKEALPLADRPHLLNPSARRDQLFGVQNHTDSSTSLEPPLTMKLNSDLISSENNKHLNLSANTYLGRWHMCLELFGRVFIDDVGTEPNSILNELGRFDVKETKFRREMEKLRNAHQKDLYLEGLDRSRPLLLQQALRQLNSQFGRRLSGATPLSVHRLKVSFKDEPGEGSGVVRSFYTAISNAFLADEKLPSLDNISSSSSRGGLSHQIRARARERDRDRRRSSGNNLPSGMVPRIVRRNERVTERTAAELENCPLSLDAPIYFYNLEMEESSQSQDDYVESGIPIHKRELGRRIYKKVFAINTENAGKITGMLLEHTPTQIIYLLSRDLVFKEKVNEALDLITGQSSSRTNRDETKGGSSSSARTLTETSIAEADEDDDCLDNSPLFYQPGKPGYYSPRPGRNGPDRLDCLRNLGRIVGLCLLQNELCPLSFNRHVIKYLLGRPISWHDLAFYDPTLYESLRQLIEDSKRPDSTEFFSSLDLTFYIQLRAEEGGGGVDLIKGGSQVEVAPDNALEYVKRYAEYRMITNPIRALQAMRRGLLDVVPTAHLEGLTAEDFRLLLNGAGDISVQQLMSYTFFSDETGGEVQDKLTKFKKWFWAVVENMTAKQKQDLLYFWTSSPAMPASAEGFQPMPSVTVKPANDHQLPTANTCISRLYVPLYSSKAILRSKFLLAIKTKVFGFV